MADQTFASWWKELPLVLIHPTTTLLDDLPRDLIINILSRLPVKTLVQSSAVCQNWYSLIKNPVCVRAHVARSISQLAATSTDHFILVTPKEFSDEPTLSIFADNENYDLCGKVKIPFQTWSKTVTIVGSCHGLVCLTDHVDCAYGGDVYLFNPVIRKFKMLKHEFSCYYDWMEKNFFTYPVLGFGFCERDSDFRVVRILYSAHQVGGKLRPRVEVYSLKSGKWRSVLGAKIAHTVFRGCNAFVDGCIFWVTAERAHARISWVVWFDLKAEVFCEVELPENYDKDTLESNLPVNIMRWNGEVAIGAVEPGGVGKGVKCGFWVLRKDDCGKWLWQKKFKVVLGDALCGIPVGFTWSGKCVIDALDREDHSRRKVNAALTKTVALNLVDLKFKDLAADGPHTVATCFEEGLVLFLD